MEVLVVSPGHLHSHSTCVTGAQGCTCLPDVGSFQEERAVSEAGGPLLRPNTPFLSIRSETPLRLLPPRAGDFCAKPDTNRCI